MSFATDFLFIACLLLYLGIGKSTASSWPISSRQASHDVAASSPPRAHSIKVSPGAILKSPKFVSFDLDRFDMFKLCHGYSLYAKNSSKRSWPFLPKPRSKSSICFIARGDGLARPFSQRLMVGKVTPSLAANFSWVSPVRSRSSRTSRGMFAWTFKALLLSDPRGI